MVRKLTCIYCFEKFKPSEIQFRCINADSPECFEKDELLEKYERRPIRRPLNKVISAPSTFMNGLPKEATCTCGMETSKVICPKCHNTLPHQFGQTDSLIVALIGAKYVGKSHYIGVLIHELRQRIGANFDAALTALDDRTTRRYKEEFHDPLYERAERLDATNTATQNTDLRRPLVYRLNIGSRSFWRRKSYPVSLAFFDTAGEDLTHIDTMTTVNRYIANADGIIFLLDPLQVSQVQQRLPRTVDRPPDNHDQEEIIRRSTQLIRNLRRQGLRNQRLKPTTKIDIPVAVSFSKIDALEGIVDDHLLRDSEHDGYLDMADIEHANRLFHSYVHDWFGPNMGQILEHNYTDYSYFGLSALGSSPAKDGTLARGIHPIRIADPLLWILHKKNIIPAKTG